MEHSPPKLPAQQLLILSLCRLSEPIALSSVFPYLPEMIESFNVDKNNVSKWAGIASAVFSLSQAVTGVLWGRAADIFGRKPVILSGMTCTMICGLLWGFSSSLTWAIVTRSLAGASNGNVGIMRTTVAEMVPQRELQPRAFSIMPLVWTIGTIFGPALGGALAKPASKYPDLFGNNTLFVNYPFVLPNLIATILTLGGLCIGWLFLRETLAKKKDKPDYGLFVGQVIIQSFKKIWLVVNKLWSKDDSNNKANAPLLKHSRNSSATSIEDANGSHDVKVEAPQRPTYKEVFNYQSNINLLVYSLLAAHSIAYDQLLPVFMHYPRQEQRASNPDVTLPFKFAGGFGINSDRIGVIQVFYGIVGMFIQFLIFPPLAQRWGVLRSLKRAVVIYPAVYILTPFTVLLPSPLSQQIGVFIIMLFKSWAVMFAFPCSTILLTNSASSLRVLGTLNGVAVSLSALGRAAGPAMGGWAFSVGASIGYGIFPWWILAVLAIAAAIPVWWLTETDGIGNDNAENAEYSPSDADIQAECAVEEPEETTPLIQNGLSKVVSESSTSSDPAVSNGMPAVNATFKGIGFTNRDLFSKALAQGVTVQGKSWSSTDSYSAW